MFCRVTWLGYCGLAVDRHLATLFAPARQVVRHCVVCCYFAVHIRIVSLNKLTLAVTCTVCARCPSFPFAVLCCAVLCCAVLCCAVLCCAVLCCAVLCCAVLCCICSHPALPRISGVVMDCRCSMLCCICACSHPVLLLSAGVVMGSLRIDAQLRGARSTVHVFGHSHMDVDRVIDGVRYVSVS